MAIQKKVNGTWQSINPKQLKGIPYTGTLPAVLSGTKAGYLHRYKIYGNIEQTGTPTPENPIMPSECGERTVNVMPSAPAEIKTNNGITVTCDGNGVYTLSGTSIGGSVVIFSISEFQIPLSSVGQGGQGTMSLFNTLPNGQVSLAYMNNGATLDTWSINSANRKSNTYSTMGGKICNAIQFYVPNGNNCDCVIKPCFTNDSIYPANYEPYGYKLPLLSGSTPVDIYLGESQTTRRIKKLVLTGTETPASITQTTDGNNYCVAYKYSDLGMTDIKDYNELTYLCSYPVFISSHFTMKSIEGLPLPNDYNDIQPGQVGGNTWIAAVAGEPTYNRYIIFCVSGITTINDFKTYLAQQYANGTPVTIWYILATEETGILNEPLRKIGDYVDTIDSTQTSAQIPTSAGSTTISWAGSGLAPSQFDSIQEWVDIPTYKRVNGEWVADN